MIAGQAEDMAFEQRPSLSVEECLHMEAGKTGGPALAAPLPSGAILAGAPAPTVDALADFGRHLGLAFQAVDDLLGIWGEPAVTGKPVGSDLRQHKKTLPVAIALARGGGAAGGPRDPAREPAHRRGRRRGGTAARRSVAPGRRRWRSARRTCAPPWPRSTGCRSRPGRAPSWRRSPAT